MNNNDVGFLFLQWQNFTTYFMKHHVTLSFFSLPVCRFSQRPSSEEQEHLQVFLRIRPFTAAERIDGECQVKIE